MFCFRARKKLIPYIEGTLNQSQSEAMAKHIAACSRCAEELALIRSASSAFRSAKSPAMEPATDLWSRIEREITVPQPPTVQVARPKVIRSLQFSGAALTAVIILFAVVNVGRFGKDMFNPPVDPVGQVSVTESNPNESMDNAPSNAPVTRDDRKNSTGPEKNLIDRINYDHDAPKPIIEKRKFKGVTTKITPPPPSVSDTRNIKAAEDLSYSDNIKNNEPADRGTFFAGAPPSEFANKATNTLSLGSPGPAGASGPGSTDVVTIKKETTCDKTGMYVSGRFYEDVKEPITDSNCFALRASIGNPSALEDGCLESDALSVSYPAPDRLICHHFYFDNPALTSVDLLNNTDDMTRNSALFSYP